MSEATAAVGCDYQDLNEIDPNYSTLPQDVYTLKVLNAEIKPIKYQRGAKAGTEGEVIKFQFAVTQHPTLSGRQIYVSFFPSEFVFKGLRRIMDATGVRQSPGSPLSEWLTALKEAGSTFKGLVIEKPDVDFKTGEARALDNKGNPVNKNELNLKEISPAD